MDFRQRDANSVLRSNIDDFYKLMNNSEFETTIIQYIISIGEYSSPLEILKTNKTTQQLKQELIELGAKEYWFNNIKWNYIVNKFHLNLFRLGLGRFETINGKNKFFYNNA